MACINDTLSIDLTIAGGQLSADVKVSAASGNLLTIQSDGLLVSGLKAFPPGMIAMWGGAVAPTSWALCDGHTESRSANPQLFAAIGTNYGVGDGTTTFNMPDFLGRMPVGFYAGGQGAVNALGLNDGQLAINRRPQHATSHSDPGHGHTITDPGHVHQIPYGNASTTPPLMAPATENRQGSFSSDSATTGITINTNTTGVTVGTGSGTDNVDAPSYLVVNFIIKLDS